MTDWGPEEIEELEADQAEAGYYADLESDPACQVCGVRESNHGLSDNLHPFKHAEAKLEGK